MKTEYTNFIHNPWFRLSLSFTRPLPFYFLPDNEEFAVLLADKKAAYADCHKAQEADIPVSCSLLTKLPGL